MSTPRFSIAILSVILALSFVLPANGAERSADLPNFIIFFTDDQGYSDIGCFGAVGFKTPHLDQLAAEGRKFTQFYVPANVCSASRAALMTGSYPARVSINGVLTPTRGENPGPGKTGLHLNEITIATLLKQKGYATCIVGKWHLGCDVTFLPTRHGFDEYFGLPYSNDMGSIDARGNLKEPASPPLPLFDGEKVIETEPDQRFLTRRYTERAVDFIKRNKDKPFFLYVPHTMPHTPLHPHPDFVGTSEHGKYGDVIQELDWSVGEVVKALKENGLDKKTMIAYTSDNGPWLPRGIDGGHAEPLRSGKGSRYEGGQRVPCIMWWPGQIKPGTTGVETLSTIDLFPTIAGLVGLPVPNDRVIDGIDAWDYISGKTNTSPRKVFFFGDKVIMEGKWKLFAPGNYFETVQRDRFPTPPVGWNNGQIQRGGIMFEKARLYNLETDIGEENDVSAEHPEVVARLMKLLDEITSDIRQNKRPLGRVAGN